jgi:hypothetical protein
LLYLIRFRVASVALQIDFFLNASFLKNVMAATDTLLKAEAFEQQALRIEANRGIRRSTQYALESL